MQTFSFPPVDVVYSSPFSRCCQTAAGAVVGMQESAGRGDDAKVKEECDGDDSNRTCSPRDDGTDRIHKIKVEHGLSESLCEKWYRSWCLPGSDGTWGWPGAGSDIASFDGRKRDDKPMASELEQHESLWKVNEETMHPSAKVPARQLLATPDEVVGFLRREDELRPVETEKEDESRDKMDQNIGQGSKAHDLIDLTYRQSLCPIETPYRWSNFESRKLVRTRLDGFIRDLIERHPNETILLVSHGGPTTFLFEQLTGRPWTDHGVATYASVSVYRHDGSWDSGKKMECLVMNDKSCSDI